MTKPKILLPEVGHGRSYGFFRDLERIAELHFVEERWTEEEWVRRIPPYEAVMITSQHPLSRKIIEAASSLRIIVKRGAKPENVDLAAATRKGILVSWTPAVNYVAVAEHTFMLILCLAKQTMPQMDRVRKGGWRTTSPAIGELDGKTIGVVGLGGIGREVARLAQAFRMRILAYDPYANLDQADLMSLEMVKLETLLHESDFVTLHATLTSETHRLIGREQLERMKRTAYLINTARGGLVDEVALVGSLEEGVIAGAGLDVFDPEPPRQDNPLLHLPNVVLTPHIAGWSEEALYRELKEAAIEIQLLFEGKQPRYPMNPEATANRQPYRI
jgi:D-3-phosphoglycerate dehydrogenase